MFEPARLVNRREQLEDLFHAALESGPECLEWACRDDAALKAEVLELLESYRAWSGELPVAQEPALPVFGPYRCDAILGSGGMGTVYRAHRQDGEFTQEAAIKILRGSLRNDWFRQRFLVEREILAGLNHPGIARLLDGGTSADGEPYLVMELVDGGPLDEYCDAQSLSQKARLQLFLQVLDAVDYAHRNLVVHRDLKPGNILVAASGNPKLLDFGLSKLAEDDVTASIHAMTPGYASPEQLLRRPVTVASDIFSAGVVLFELLTGLSPFGAEEPWALALKRVAGEVEIRHAPELDRDLSCILRKALEHEPERRYASAKEFRDDLDRYLNARPVLARPHGLAYRAGKFVRRNRIAVTSAALVLAAAFTGASLTLWQARKAAARFAELRGFARFVVQDLHTEIQKLPGSTNLQRLSVERSLGYLDRLAAESAPDAALRIEVADGYRRLGDVLGNPYRSNLGDRGKAESAYRKGLVLLREGPKTAASRRIAAELAVQLAGTAGFGGSKGEGLAEIRRAAKELAGLAAAAQDDSALQLSAARAWEALGTRLVVGGGNIESEGSAEAEKVYRESIGLANAVLTREPANEAAKLQLVQCELNLGMLKGSDRPVDAIAHYRQAARLLDETGQRGSRRLRAVVLSNLGWAEGQTRMYTESVTHIGQARDILRELSAADPDDTNMLYAVTSPYRALGIVEAYRKNFAASVENFRAAAEIHQRLLHRDPANKVYKFLRAELLVRTGDGLMAQGRTAEAAAAAREGLDALRLLASASNASLSHQFGACRWLVETRVPALRDGTAAEGFCRKAVESTKGDDPDGFSGLAKALLLNGDRTGAVLEMEKALALLPVAKPGQPISRQRTELESELRAIRQSRAAAR